MKNLLRSMEYAAHRALICVVFVGGMLTISQAQDNVEVTQDHYLKGNANSFNRQLGSSIAVSGNTIAIASRDGTSAGQAPGAVYVFVQEGVSWTQQARIENPLPGTFFTESLVALWGDDLAWSAICATPGGSFTGCVLTFSRSNEVWAFTGDLVGSNTEPVDRFGESIAMSDGLLVVGAREEESAATGVNGDESDNSLFDAGAAYVFRHGPTGWTQEAYLKPSNTQSLMSFGQSVACHGDRVAVGAPIESTGLSFTGAAYVFHYDGATWSEEAFLKASIGTQGDHFGETIAIYGDSLLVGSEDDDGPGIGIDGFPHSGFPPVEDTGTAYLFTRDAGGWTEQHRIKASNTHENMKFASAIAINDDHLVIGAGFEDGLGQGIDADQTPGALTRNSGAAYLYDRRGTELFQSAYLKPAISDAVDVFGASVALLDGLAIIGAPGEDSAATGVDGDASDNSLAASGAAYVFDVNGPDPSVANRTFGSNAQSYTADVPELGTTWTGTVDLTTTGHAFAALVFFLEPTQLGPVWNDQWLLVGPNFPSGELFGLAPVAGPQATFQIVIPEWLPLLGLPIASQAVHFGGVQPLALSNAQDLVLGAS